VRKQNGGNKAAPETIAKGEAKKWKTSAPSHSTRDQHSKTREGGKLRCLKSEPGEENVQKGRRSKGGRHRLARK